MNKLAKQDISTIEDYLSSLVVDLSLSDEKRILPFVNFEKHDIGEYNKMLYGTMITSHELQKRSKYRLLFLDGIIGGVTIIKPDQFNYLLFKSFYVGNTFFGEQAIKMTYKIFKESLESNLTEILPLELKEILDLSRDLTKSITMGQKFGEKETILEPNKIEKNILNDRTQLETTPILNHFYLRTREEPYKGHMFSRIILPAITTRNLKQSLLYEDILRFHEFFENLK